MNTLNTVLVSIGLSIRICLASWGFWSISSCNIDHKTIGNLQKESTSQEEEEEEGWGGEGQETNTFIWYMMSRSWSLDISRMSSEDPSPEAGCDAIIAALVSLWSVFSSSLQRWVELLVICLCEKTVTDRIHFSELRWQHPDPNP